MLVRELIKKLEKLKQDKEIYLTNIDYEQGGGIIESEIFAGNNLEAKKTYIRHDGKIDTYSSFQSEEDCYILASGKVEHTTTDQRRS